MILDWKALLHLKTSFNTLGKLIFTGQKQNWKQTNLLKIHVCTGQISLAQMTNCDIFLPMVLDFLGCTYCIICQFIQIITLFKHFHYDMRGNIFAKSSKDIVK